jgi:phosphoribosylaminoimidazole carboxylase
LFKDTESYAKSLEQEVLQKVENLEEEGWDKYVETRLKK